MIKINQLKLNSKAVHDAKEGGTDGLIELLKVKTGKILKISHSAINKLNICRESIDARKKPDIYYIYTIEVCIENEEKILRGFKSRESAGIISVGGVQISVVKPFEYRFPESGEQIQKHPAVIVGTGPAGLFCGYFLAVRGYRPILLERGKCVDERKADVERFWETGCLDTCSNVQFGEGGAGTFSDGKLNTLVKDKNGRNRAVLQVFVDCGAKEEILYEAKPHIGTDVLCKVIKRMRETIIEHGGQVCFGSRMTDVRIKDGRVCGVEVNGDSIIPCEQLVLAIGHSARDTFEMLYSRNIPMESKAFAVGLRVEHTQTLINRSQYGMDNTGMLGAAPYKLTARSLDGRGVYSFCMCPGGYVVNSSSENGRLAVNGMSYSGRNGRNANSAIIVSVNPEDYESEHPLAGVEFQRRLEERAFRLAEGRIPMQRYEVFKTCVEQGKSQEELGRKVNVDTGMFLEDNADCGILSCDDILCSDMTAPEHRGISAWADVSGILPDACNKAFVEGMESFGRNIRGFNRGDVILSGVESRTSSPVRIHRDETLQSCVKGLYPCGEGAGYAGGITSAAMDGLLVAERIASLFKPYASENEEG